MAPRLAAALLLLGACKFPYPADVRDDDATTDGGDELGGGDTAAQATIAGTVRTGPSVVPSATGGVIVAFETNGTTALAGTTFPCASCSIVAKLNSELTLVDWYAYADTPLVRASRLAASPDGNVFWALEAAGDDTYSFSIGGSRFAQPITIAVTGNSDQGQESGGSRVVVGLGPAGEARWAHNLRQANTAPGNFLGQFNVFAAADGAIVSTFGAKGTLEHVAAGDVPTSTVVPTASVVLHELAPATGRTASLRVIPYAEARSTPQAATGMPGLAGRGFFRRDTDSDVSGADLGDRLRVGRFANGFDTVLTYATVVPAGDVRFTAAVLGGQLGAYAPIRSSASIAGTSFTAPRTNGDALFTLLDPVSPAVLAQLYVGGRGVDSPSFMVGSGSDIYVGGTYTSTDLSIGDQSLPPPLDAGSTGLFVARVGPAGGALVPAWARGAVTSGNLALLGATADRVSGDLYVVGSTSAGDLDLGIGSLTGTFVARLRRVAP